MQHPQLPAPPRYGNWNANVELLAGAKFPAVNNPYLPAIKQLMEKKEHPLVEEIELITTGFAWWNNKPHREQLSDRLKSFEKQVREEAYEQMKKDLVDKEEAVIDAVDRERERIRSIIEYICNKNSKTIADGGFNHAQFLMDIEELERELAE